MCMPNSRHEFSLFCSCVDRLYRSKFGAKDRSAGVNDLYVRFRLSVFHLNTNEPFSAFNGRRVKRNRRICTCHSQSVGRATTMVRERNDYGTKSLFYIRMSFSLNRDLHSTVILPLFFISIIITPYASDFLTLRSSLISSITETRP